MNKGRSSGHAYWMLHQTKSVFEFLSLSTQFSPSWIFNDTLSAFAIFHLKAEQAPEIVHYKGQCLVGDGFWLRVVTRNVDMAEPKSAFSFLWRASTVEWNAFKLPQNTLSAPLALVYVVHAVLCTQCVLIETQNSVALIDINNNNIPPFIRPIHEFNSKMCLRINNKKWLFEVRQCRGKTIKKIMAFFIERTLMDWMCQKWRILSQWPLPNV